MKAKLTFPVSNGQTSRCWRSGDAICQGSVLPKLPIRANLILNRLVIRWMSVEIWSFSFISYQQSRRGLNL